MDAPTIDNWPKLYGGESIIDLRTVNSASSSSSSSSSSNGGTGANPLFARGTFGEISVALVRDAERQGLENPPTSGGTGSSDRPLRLVAVKTILRSTMVSFEIGSAGDWHESKKRKLSPNVAHELDALHKLQPHPNIVTLLAVYNARETSGSSFSSGFRNSINLSLAFEYCPTDLYLTMEWRRRTVVSLLSMETIGSIARDLFAALCHCHAHDILHRDIKPGNLLVSSTGVVQLCDFGLAISMSSSSPIVDGKEHGATTVGDGLCTLAYRPPEVLMGGNYACASADMYSAGVVLAELILGQSPLFAGINNLDQLNAVFDCLGTPTETHWPDAKTLPHAQLEFRPREPRLVTDYLPRLLEEAHSGDDVDSPRTQSSACSVVADVLQQCLQLDPKRRMTSAVASQRCNESNHVWASRRTMQCDLIPPDLEEPFLLSSSAVDNDDLAVATHQALSLALTRRTFLKNLDVWKQPD